MVEAAVAVFVFIVCALFLIDLCRYVSTKAALTRGCQQALDLAEKVAYLDMGPFDAAQGGGDPKFLSAYNRVLASALLIPSTLLVQRSTDSDGGIQLIPYLFSASGHPLEPVLNVKTDAAFVRPGERYVADDGYVLNHPTAAFPQPVLDLDYQTALSEHPFVVEMRARFRFVTPFLGRLVVRGQAIGFREVYLARGAGAAPSTVVPDTTLVSPSYPITTVYVPPPVVTTAPVTTTTIPPGTTTTLPPCLPPPCAGVGGNVGVWVDSGCNCVCKPGRKQISAAPLICVYKSE